MPRPALTDTAVIVLHWGKPETTRIMLESLRAAYPNRQGPTVMLIENGPPPVAAGAFNVEVLRLPRNVGYGTANNLGIRSAVEKGAKFFVLLNNDVGVRRGIFEAMREAADEPGVGLVGAVLQEAQGPVYGGGTVSWRTLRTALAREPAAAEHLQYIHGACLGITHACVEKCGMLREDFFLYWEDVDYGLRARRAGFRLAVVPRPVLPHARSFWDTASPTKTYYLARNALHLVRDHGPLPARLWARLLLPARRRLAERRGKYAVARGLADAERGITGPAP